MLRLIATTFQEMIKKDGQSLFLCIFSVEDLDCRRERGISGDRSYKLSVAEMTQTSISELSFEICRSSKGQGMSSVKCG